MPFEFWIAARSYAYRTGHQIPYMPEMWTGAMLAEFVQYREE
ncbi:hypothetical protein RTM1035_14932 [Roseovarius sp. TM1035]|jgi:hypothetical protein|nr:hypothetical protein [Roseovarius sp. TM1035]AWZ19116.1 Hypothetical protein RAK1035_0405 [Roseovarius sp. AK1035]EDM33289.1 hypothetical protein RTM1035_14932 [Roseovarius sp. TM1035]